MRRPYYQDYVSHMLRVYYRHDTKDLNCQCVDNVIKRQPLEKQEIMALIFKSGTIDSAIAENNLDKKIVYSVLVSITKEIAKERGLI